MIIVYPKTTGVDVRVIASALFANSDCVHTAPNCIQCTVKSSTKTTKQTGNAILSERPNIFSRIYLLMPMSFIPLVIELSSDSAGPVAYEGSKI